MGSKRSEKDQSKDYVDEVVKRWSLERLTSDKANKHVIKGFHNSRNSHLQYYLQKCAWGQDKNNETVIYLIKDGDLAAYYFSLKCGMLLKNGSKSDPESLEKPEIKEDQLLVNSTIPAIEIAQFCVNEKWAEKCKTKGFGSVVFYKYILPLIKEISTHVGCRYIYLYAADDTEDETLVRYYESLGFKKVSGEEYCHVFPQYDALCTLMFAPLSKYKICDDISKSV